MTLFHKRLIYFSLVVSYLLYNVYVYTSGTEEKVVITEEARRGRQVFQDYNCISCHQIYGLGGHMGPDLTNTVNEKGPMYPRAFIMAGTQKMPKFDLTPQELDDIIAYLTYVSETSQYQTTGYSLTWYGTVNYNSKDEGQ